MIKIEMSINERCTICTHFGYCQVYWGNECKRQGGSRTPRLKNSSSSHDDWSTKTKMVSVSKNTAKRSDRITTRKVSWNLVY